MLIVVAQKVNMSKYNIIIMNIIYKIGGLTGPGAQPYTGTYQSIVATIEIGGGFPRSIGVRKPPRPGPYISEQQAIDTAKQMIPKIQSGIKTDARIPSAPSEWTGITSIEAEVHNR